MIEWVFAFLSYPLTLLVFVASMVAAVVIAGVLEVRTPPRRWKRDSRSAVDHLESQAAVDVRTTPRGDITSPRTEQPPQRRADGVGVVAADQSSQAHPVATAHSVGTTDEAPVVEQPFSRHELLAVESTRDSGIETTGAGSTLLALAATGSLQDSWFRLGPLGIDAEMAGVLFAAYVASGGSEWSRVTGWVRASSDPPSFEGVSTGERLRGKPAKVRALLECRDDSRNWVTIDDRTDIALAIQRRAPRDVVLIGLVLWWRLSTSATPALRPHEVAPLKFGLSAIKREWRLHPLAPKIQDVIEACRVAEAAGVGLEQHLVLAGRIQSDGGGDVDGSARVPGMIDSGVSAPSEDRIAG